MHAGYRLLLSAAFALSGALTSASGTLADNLPCDAGPAVAIERKADLPRPVLDIIEKGRPMADVGEPFTSTDVVSDPSLPTQRFISAYQNACDLAVNFERGGRAAGRGLILLRQTEHGWLAREVSYSSPVAS